MKISFHGAAGTVTGSKHLITLWDNERILLDCGMFQGLGKETLALNRHFGFEPKSVNHVVLTHAHIDHSGLLPKLVKDGFTGKIYCTPATFDICKIMLMDSAHIQEADVRFVNKRKRLNNQEEVGPLYTSKDVERCLEQFEVVDYDQNFKINDHIKLLLTDNGHILGSSTVNLTINEVNEVTKVAYTGDIGRYKTALLKDPATFPQADILLCESTYGDRLHTPGQDAEQEILSTIIHTCKKKKGNVVIPAFSLGRTQEIVYALNKLNLYGLLPDVQIYVDSPLAINATNILRQYAHCLNDSVQNFRESVDDPFGFNRLIYVRDKKESQSLNSLKKPHVIISAAGMAEAGRIKHHIMNNIDDEKNTILLVGYAGPQSLSGRLRSGAPKVKIYGMEFEVKSEVHGIDSLSAHGDYQDMIKYLSCQDPKKLKKVFIVHGEKEPQKVYAQHLKDAGFRNIVIPKQHEVFEV